MPIAADLPNGDLDVAIVGAGAAGLAAARRLMELRPDLTVLVFEAGSRIGGRAWTVETGSSRAPVDLGCGWLHGARTNAWTHRAEDLGIAVDHMPAPWDRGGREPGLPEQDQRDMASARQGFFERLEAWSARDGDVAMNALLEPGGRWNALLDAVGTYLNGVELDQTSVLDYQNYDPGPGPDWRLRDGYGHLVATYGAPVPVATGTPVTRIDHGGRSVVRLDTPRGIVTARAVILAVPSNALAHERLAFNPPLPRKTAAAAALPLGFAEKMFLTSSDPEALPVEGHFLGSPYRVGTGAYHVRPFGRPVIECYFAGALARELHRQGPEAALAFAIEELAAHLGNDIGRHAAFGAMSSWQADPFIGGCYSYAAPGAAGQRAVLAEPVDDRLFFAGEACSPHRFSTAHGAYESGVTAADQAIAALGPA